MRFQHLLASSLIAVLALVGCSKDESPAPASTPAAAKPAVAAPASGPSILDYVPADTAYYQVSEEPAPKAVLDKFSPLLYTQLPAMISVFEKAMAKAEAEAEAETTGEDSVEEETARKVVKALFAELKTVNSAEALAALGFKLDVRSAFYGVGLVPVLRIELADAMKFWAMIDRVENNAGVKAEQRTVGGQAYRALGAKELQVVFATVGNELVVTLLPAANPDEALARQLLGLDKPAKSLRGTSGYESVIKDHGLIRNGVMVVDVVRLTEQLMAPNHPADQAILTALGESAPEVTPECQADYRALAAQMPRLVGGSTRADAGGIDTYIKAELATDLASGIKSFAGAAPAMPADSVAGVALGANVIRFMDFFKARAGAVANAPFRCAELTEFNESMAKAVTDLDSQPLPPVAGQIQGLTVGLSKLDLSDPMTPVYAGSAVLAAEDPKSLVMMAQMFSPELAALDLTPGGDAVSVPLPMPAPGVQTVHAALGIDTIVVSVNGADGSGAKALAAVGNRTDGTILEYRINGSLMQTMLDMSQAQAQGAMSPEEAAEFDQIMGLSRVFYGQMLEQLSVELRATATGLELVQKMDLK